jgi:serine-type D-Ala-D-Ala endopeptidase (penicillin-binding protein 7)
VHDDLSQHGSSSDTDFRILGSAVPTLNLPVKLTVKIRHSIVSLLLICSSVVVASNTQAAAPKQQDLAAGSALLVDLKTNQVLYERNADSVVPIASVTKLMTAMVTLDAKLPLDQILPITIRDTQELRGVFSRVRVGSELSRYDTLWIALMASENRAASSLAHHYPGGHAAFVAAMNAKAKALGMRHTRFVEPTGLSEHNVSSARDLVLMLKAANQYPLIRQFTTTSEKTQAFRKPNYTLGFRNTNNLVRKPGWSVQLSKTGYTGEAGRCLVMNTVMNKRPVAFVVLDAFGKYTHMADANRLKRWLETGKVTAVPQAAISYRQQKLAQRQAKATQ